MFILGTRRLLTATLLSSLAIWALSTAAVAEPKPKLTCDDVTPAPGAKGYKLKGNRCEGRYQPQVSAGVVPYSFTLGDAPVATGQELVLNWIAAATNGPLSVRVRAAGGPAYQMKAQVEPSESLLRWSTAQAKNEGVHALAVLAMTGDMCMPVFTDPNAVKYVATFQSTSILSQVNFRVKTPDGTPVWQKPAYDETQHMLKVEFPKAAVGDAGKYMVGLTAQASNGSVSASLTFWHAP